MLFVPHDISEALRLGRRVLVMDAGKIEQYAPPAELLRAPATDFVHRLVEKERRDVYKRQLYALYLRTFKVLLKSYSYMGIHCFHDG